MNTKYLKDRYGTIIGRTEEQENSKYIYDRYGRRIGRFDGTYTYDEYGTRIGEGDLLAALLPKF